MILHIPHSKTKLINNNQHNQHNKDTKYKNASQMAINHLTDWYTDELFEHENSERIVFLYSRIWCDVERFENDPMEKIGQGLYYTHYKGEKLRDFTDEEYKMVKLEYDKHHKKLNMLTSKLLSLFSDVVVVDCHSFTPNNDDPDICIGVNPSTDYKLVSLLHDYFKMNNMKTKINSPFEGSILPTDFTASPNVQSIMIEVNKNLYLEHYDASNNFNTKSVNFNNTKNIIHGALDIINIYENYKERI